MSINLRKFYNEISDNDINFFTGVPDSLLKNICSYIEENTFSENHIIAANEGSALAIGAGYYLATGKIPLVYMQNSGLGNAVNPLTSLTHEEIYKIPILLMIGWRGQPNFKDEPQHIKQGAITKNLLDLLDIPTFIIGPEEPKNLPNLKKALKLIKKIQTPVAILIRKSTFEGFKRNILETTDSDLLSREEAIGIIVESFPKDVFYISTTGMTSRELYELREQKKLDHHNDFLMVGSMGHSSSIALGVAISNKSKKIVCLDGDGSAIMHLGSQAIISAQNPSNLVHIILNNGAHDSVGGQPTVGKDISLTSIAKAFNYKKVFKVKSKYEIASTLEEISFNDGPVFLEIIIKKGARSDLGRPNSSPKENKRLFMKSLK